MVTGLYTLLFSPQVVLGSTCLFTLHFQECILSYIHTGTKKCSKSLKVAEKESAGEFPAALLLPPPDQDWYGVFSVGYLPCYMLSIQLGVTTVNAVQNPLEKSAVVKV